MAKRKTSVKVEGLRELRDNLYRLPHALRENIVFGILEGRAQPIAETAADLAPVRTGRLRDEIHVNRKAQDYRPEAGVFAVHIGPRRVGSLRGFMQEYGTLHHQPQPFMRPAWDGAVHDLARGIADDMWEAIRKELKLD